jgi:hypothetical protein
MGYKFLHLVELDVRGGRLGTDPLVRKPLPQSLRLLNTTMRSFIAFQQSPRLCPPQGARWPTGGGAISLHRAPNTKHDSVVRLLDDDRPSRKSGWQISHHPANRAAPFSRPLARPSMAVNNTSVDDLTVAQQLLRDTGTFATWAPGFRAERLRCRPLFEALSDFRGEASWQCVTIEDDATLKATLQDPRAAISEGWTFQFDDVTETTGQPWWAWHKLEKFWIDGNFAYGEIPSSIAELWPRMRTLDLYSNSLSGQLPPQLADMKLLHQIQLQHNHFSGRVPHKLFHPETLPEIVVIHLELNANLTGCVHSEAFGTQRSTALAVHTTGSQVQRLGCS